MNFAQWVLGVMMFTVATFLCTMLLGQTIALTEHEHSTSNHFATLKVYNKIGSKHPHQKFSTIEGEVVMIYETFTRKGGCHPRAPMTGSHRDCPDLVIVETPEGVIAVPQEVFIEEEETAEIKLYRYIGG